MAVLAAPDIDWGGDEPQSQAALVDSADMLPPTPIVFGPSALVLASPSVSQLINDPGVGYPS